MDRIRDAILRGDASYLVGWISGRQMIDIPIETMERWLRTLKPRIEAEEINLQKYKEQGKFGLWEGTSGGTIDLWFRKRMTEEGLFKAGHQQPPEIHLLVPLHIFFIAIDETPEQLERLRRGDPTLAAEKKKVSTATPAIERVMQKIKGVDSLARKVAPTDASREFNALFKDEAS